MYLNIYYQSGPGISTEIFPTGIFESNFAVKTEGTETALSGTEVPYPESMTTLLVHTVHTFCTGCAVKALGVRVLQC
jgi:hypothetical protein